MDDFTIDWQAESLRVTGFAASQELSTQSATWWEDLVGDPPEASDYQRRHRLLRQSGSFENGRLVLTVQPGRINWVFSDFEGDAEAFQSGPLTQPLNAALEAFLPLIRRWFSLDSCPTLYRLAFGAVLLYPVENKEVGYQQLAGFLPAVELDPENMSDFLFQVNRPRDTETSIENLKINRLSKWSVAAFRDVEFRVAQIPANIASQQEFSACRLELDINTSQYFQGELVPEHLSEILNELVTFGQEIIENGDTP